MNYSFEYAASHLPAVAVALVAFCLTVVTPGVSGMECYVCKTSLPTYDGPVNCPNVNNPGTTTKQHCPSGVCLTFRGSQQRNTNMIEDGIVRLCSTGDNIRKIFGTSLVSLDSGESCRQVAYSSSNNVHDNTAISGRVCTCTTDLCNTHFQSNTGASGSALTGIAYPVTVMFVVLLTMYTKFF